LNRKKERLKFHVCEVNAVFGKPCRQRIGRNCYQRSIGERLNLHFPFMFWTNHRFGVDASLIETPSEIPVVMRRSFRLSQTSLPLLRKEDSQSLTPHRMVMQSSNYILKQSHYLS